AVMHTLPALPFCHVALKTEKPKSAKYPKNLKTLGDHIRKKRLELGLLQKEVASRMGVDAESIYRWETNRASPSILQVPRIIRFLGHDPLPVPAGLPDQLRNARQRLGLSQAAMARQLGIDPTTLRKWERGRARPSTRSLKLIKSSVADQGIDRSREDPTPRGIAGYKLR